MKKFFTIIIIALLSIGCLFATDATYRIKSGDTYSGQKITFSRVRVENQFYSNYIKVNGNPVAPILVPDQSHVYIEKTDYVEIIADEDCVIKFRIDPATGTLHIYVSE